MDLTGRTAGTYRIQDKLGEGGMGAVYRGVDTMVERTVAVKVLKPEIAGNPEIVERFRTEAVTLARLNHPSIATLYTFFREGTEYFMVMEFVSGSTLEGAIRDTGAMPWRRAVDIMIHILEALQHAHQYGVLHRDIKPANIMLPKNGGVKVTDFGIAQVLGAARLTREGRMVGTLEYLAPERIVGKPFDERSDLYSAGVVFYEMLSGHLPFEADSDYALIRAQTEAPPPPLQNFGVNVPQPLIEFLWRSLAKLPEQRYANAGEMVAALRDAKARAELEAPAIKETRLAEQAARPAKATVLAAQAPQAAPVAYAYQPPVSGPPTQSFATSPPAKKNAGLLWALGGIGAVVLLAAAAGLVMHFSGTPAANNAKNSPAAADPGAPAVAKPKEGIVAVGPPVDVSGPAANNNNGPGPTPQPVEIPAPSSDKGSSAPRTIRTIKDIRSIVIAKMPEGLDQLVRSEIRDQLGSRLRLATDIDAADAVMRCEVMEDDGGNRVANATGRVFGFKGKMNAKFSVFDKTGAKLLWKEEVSDKRGLAVMPSDGKQKMANRVIDKLRKELL
ncbi:MAG TPA: serine/threonine-protein kinase [Bryobacteraceae bacterium]|jgi:serine/threonine-protein kinase